MKRLKIPIKNKKIANIQVSPMSDLRYVLNEPSLACTYQGRHHYF